MVRVNNYFLQEQLSQHCSLNSVKAQLSSGLPKSSQNFSLPMLSVIGIMPDSKFISSAPTLSPLE